MLGHAQAHTDPEGLAGADALRLGNQRRIYQIVSGRLRLRRRQQTKGHDSHEGGLLQAAEKTGEAHAVKFP
jgi:hypothetical protein